MQYELIKNSNVGVIVDPTPVLTDIKDTFKVSFILPNEGAYIALFRDESGVEYKAIVRGNEVAVPKELLTKEQRCGLTVCLIDGDAILHAWECHPLKIGAFLYLRRTQWQITAGLSDKEVFERLAEIERSQAETKVEMCSQSQELKLLIEEQQKLISDLQAKIENHAKAIAELQDGKFTILKFGGKKND